MSAATDGFALVAKADNSKGIHNMLSAIHLKKDIVKRPSFFERKTLVVCRRLSIQRSIDALLPHRRRRSVWWT